MITSRMSRIDWLLATNGNPCGFFDSLFSDFLGPAAALAGGILFPEFAIPAEIAGGFLGGTAGGLLGGASPGQSLIQGAETGALAGATGALTGADFSPGNTPVPGGIFGGAGAGGVLGDIFGSGATPGAAPDVVPGGAGSVTPTAAPAAAPTGSLTPPGGAASAAGITGSDPILGADAFLGQSGGQSFLGATGGGGTSNISGLPTGGDTFAANPAGAGGLPGGGPSSFLSPGTDQALPGVTGGSSADIASGGGSGVSGFISKNWPALAGAGILGVEALSSKQPLPQEQALQANATQAAGQSAALEAPLQTGILPPGAQQAVSAATASSKAAAKSNFASLGLSGSTMEAQQMQAIDRNAAAQTFQIADSLLSKGIDLSKLSAQDLTQLLDEQLKQDQQFTGALTQFAGGLAGGKLSA
jgi:hypothetical protein